jgi:phosphoenolpyruvate carboxykinase (ATP)
LSSFNVTSPADALARSKKNTAMDCSPVGEGFAGEVQWNASAAQLYETAVAKGEGCAASGGGLAVVTTPHTGRSPADKFILCDAAAENSIWWESVKPIAPESFTRLKEDAFAAAAKLKQIFVQDLYAGADPGHRLSVRVLTEFAWHALFIRHLMIRPPLSGLSDFSPQLTILDVPSFKADPARHGVRSPAVIACDLTQGLVIIGGTSYAGEMKKSVFTVLNHLLPERQVMPMHCSANVGKGGDTALFFGLSGTGKTTLSADPERSLIGDDEHGWSENGVFNFEGGCYAKVIRLSQAEEPAIFSAAHRFATVLENVTLDPITREPDFADGSLTENTRAAYPLDYIANASKTGLAGHPSNIIMLTADAFGVMPPIARLSASQAMYHFLSGYTAKVAGTEKGVTEPQATFSACFGAPFMPRHPAIYGNLLRRLIAKHEVTCWLVNTGWTGGPYGTGRRMPIAATRGLLAEALEGRLGRSRMRIDPWFGFEVPVEAAGIEPRLLWPRDTWADKSAYDAQAQKLAQLFTRNFAPFEAHVDSAVRAAAPKVAAKAR